MASPVSICSQALILLGAQTISSFTDGTDRALIAANLYPDERKAMMRSHPWNCCVQRAQLAPEAAAPAFGYPAQFVLPAECLRLLDIGGECWAPVDYQLEAGRRVLTDGTILNVRYIADTPEAQWDDLLVGLMKLRMKAAMAYAITKSSTVADAAMAEFQAAFRIAKAIDGQENPPEQITDSPLLSARLRGQVFAGDGVY